MSIGYSGGVAYVTFQMNTTLCICQLDLFSDESLDDDCVNFSYHRWCKTIKFNNKITAIT